MSDADHRMHSSYALRVSLVLQIAEQGCLAIVARPAPGASWFFTANLLQRHSNNFLVQHIDVQRALVRRVERPHPFTIDAWVVPPEHMHVSAPWVDAAYSLTIVAPPPQVSWFFTVNLLVRCGK